MHAIHDRRQRRHSVPDFTRLACATLVLVGLTACSNPPRMQEASDRWLRAQQLITPDAALEAHIKHIVASMNLAQKIGQMTQPEIKHVKPDEVRRYYIGSVLNGGGSWPDNNKHASVADWLRLAESYHAASMTTDMAVKVPLIWGTDAVHGHNNVFGATLFPHNIGLGATHDPELVHDIGAATARAVRATGIQWVFGPTLAVARDDRWGRSYESYSEDPGLVARLGGAYVRGMQDKLKDDANTVATAKHFIGDGGTDQGKDQGVNQSSQAQMIALHAQGYVAALGAGAQTVMASFNSWNDVQAGVDYGKMHGSHALLTDVLKTQMGFDGFVVSDWNGIGQVPGCSNASCPRAINAGIDMVMVPEDWKAFIKNTVAQVERGEIPMSRIDDAVTRILRVKLRAGLFDKSPSQGAWAGHAEALQARALARRAVRESLVLLKNEGSVLPLARTQRILVVGKSADSLENQSGGWSLSWQGTGNPNSDFPAGETVLGGLRAALGADRVVYSADANGVDLSAFDAVVAVIGETPFAEGNGDIPPSGTLHHASRHPQDLAVLRAVSGKGRPVVTVFMAGRPLYVNDLLNLSDAFVAAWLPGTEGGGVADLLLRKADGALQYEFTGRLPFSWPAGACQTPLNKGEGGTPLFAPSFGLTSTSRAALGRLDTAVPTGGCGAQREVAIFRGAAQHPYVMQAASTAGRWPAKPMADDLNAIQLFPPERPELRVTTVQLNTQQDAKLISWSGPARWFAWSAQPAALNTYRQSALVFDLQLVSRAQGPVLLAMTCGAGCSGQLDLAGVLARLTPGAKRRIVVPLACFAARGADLTRIDEPFSIAADAPFAAAFANIRVAADAANDADALPCAELTPLSKQ